MVQWARDMLHAMRPIAALLDAVHESGDYSASLDNQLAKVADPELTPSARMLREMRDRKLSFFRLAMTYSEQWAQYFRERPLAADVQSAFDEETRTFTAGAAGNRASLTMSASSNTWIIFLLNTRPCKASGGELPGPFPSGLAG